MTLARVHSFLPRNEAEAILSGNLEAMRLLGIRRRAKLVDWLKFHNILPLETEKPGGEHA